MSLFLLGAFAGALLMTAIYRGTEARFERRRPQSRTPASIQHLFTVRS